MAHSWHIRRRPRHVRTRHVVFRAPESQPVLGRRRTSRQYEALGFPGGFKMAWMWPPLLSDRRSVLRTRRRASASHRPRPSLRRPHRRLPSRRGHRARRLNACRQRPGSACTRPERMAARNDSKSRSFWSAYDSANAARLSSNAALDPRYPARRAGWPARA